MSQEIIFDHHFQGYGCEDTELGMRLARQGMTLYYNPDACVFHNHPMSDEEIYQRQYKVGKALVTFSLVQPETIDEARSKKIELLELFKRLPQDKKIDSNAIEYSGNFTKIFEKLGLTLDDFDILASPLRGASAVKSKWARGLAASTIRSAVSSRHRVLALRLELAELCGMADAWLGEESSLAAHSLCASFLHQRIFQDTIASAVSQIQAEDYGDHQEFLTDVSMQELVEDAGNGADLIKSASKTHFCNFAADGIWWELKTTGTDPQIWLKPKKASQADEVSIIIAVAAERSTNMKIYWRYREEEFGEDRVARFVIGPEMRIVRWTHKFVSKAPLQVRLDPAEEINRLQFRGLIKWGYNGPARRRSIFQVFRSVTSEAPPEVFSE